MIRCLKKRGTKRGEIIRINIYASKIFFIQNQAIHNDPFPTILRTIYEIKDKPHKNMIQRDTDNNII